jgi:branched-chain amino acid transport system ATP-binding protein
MRTGSGDGAMLRLDSVSVTYNRLIPGIRGVSLEVPEGAIVALLGSNGAGKTTTLRAISGFLRSEPARVSGGSITLAGKDITGLRPNAVAKLGVSLVPERDKVFRTLTVEENLRSVVPSGLGKDFKPKDVYELFPALDGRRKQTAGYLSGGERQMLAVGLALMNSPRMLLLDELSLGISPLLLSKLLLTIREINREHGTTVLLVEQNARAAMDVADMVYIVESGRVVLQGTSAELQERSDVRDLYLGLSDEANQRSYADAAPRRRVRALYG